MVVMTIAANNNTRRNGGLRTWGGGGDDACSVGTLESTDQQQQQQQQQQPHRHHILSSLLYNIKRQRHSQQQKPQQPQPQQQPQDEAKLIRASTQKSTRARSVHFATDLQQRFIPILCEFDQEEKERLYYTCSHDFERFRMQSRILAKETRMKGTQVTFPVDQAYQQALALALQLCEDEMDQLVAETEPAPADAATTTPYAIAPSTSIAASLAKIQQHNLNGWAKRKQTCRGLEHWTSKNHHVHRLQVKAEHRRAVLDTCRRCCSSLGGNSSNGNEATTTMIAQSASDASRSSRLLATWMGRADAQYQIPSTELDALTNEIMAAHGFDHRCRQAQQHARNNNRQMLLRAYHANVVVEQQQQQQQDNNDDEDDSSSSSNSSSDEESDDDFNQQDWCPNGGFFRSLEHDHKNQQDDDDDDDDGEEQPFLQQQQQQQQQYDHGTVIQRPNPRRPPGLPGLSSSSFGTDTTSMRILRPRPSSSAVQQHHHHHHEHHFVVL